MRLNTILLLAFGIMFCLVFQISAETKKPMVATSEIERGAYLVMIGHCNGCHTPKVFTDKGPDLDKTRILAGHPADQKLPEIPAGVIGPDKWGTVGSNDFTAWYGPWGVSFSANLTPHKETGIGSWTEQMFFQAMRTGKHMGAAQGRSILPPMPWQSVGGLHDQDLKAIWVYLQSLKPVKNAVPDPISPQAPVTK